MSDKKVVVSVNDVSKMFHIPLEASNGIKQKLINHIKGRKGYREFSPLNGISFTIEEGDFFGIVGRNGSGKSTLLKTIAGIYSPTSGSVDVIGSLVPFIELGVGFNPELTGRENVYLNGALLGFSRSEMELMYDDIVKFAELHDFMEERLKNYSSGMQVRLAFSIAIRAKGDILLLDEVLAVGDAAFQQKCSDYFEDLKQKRKTVILVTHDMNAVKRFCTRAMMIADGKIEGIGTPEEIADIYTKENIESIEDDVLGDESDEDDSKLQSDNENISANIISGTSIKQGDMLEIEINYPSHHVDHYIGISLHVGGISVAELNSKPVRLSAENTNINLKIDTSHMNPLSYQLSVAIFKRDTSALMAFNNKAGNFFIKGFDETRGGALKIEGTWKS
jgi:ABC-2 type transport system ATP-binding protein